MYALITWIFLPWLPSLPSCLLNTNPEAQVSCKRCFCVSGDRCSERVGSCSVQLQVSHPQSDNVKHSSTEPLCSLSLQGKLGGHVRSSGAFTQQCCICWRSVLTGKFTAVKGEKHHIHLHRNPWSQVSRKYSLELMAWVPAYTRVFLHLVSDITECTFSLLKK